MDRVPFVDSIVTDIDLSPIVERPCKLEFTAAARDFTGEGRVALKAYSQFVCFGQLYARWAIGLQ